MNMSHSIFEETMVEMSWVEIEKLSQEDAVILLPVGVIEEHGPHMGLGVDIQLSHVICRLMKGHLTSNGITSLIAPPFYWGINHVTESFPGSFTVRKETLVALLYDIFASLNRWGFHTIFAINFHGDFTHNTAILEGIHTANSALHAHIAFVLEDSSIDRFQCTGHEDYILRMETPHIDHALTSHHVDVHAGAYETGMMAYYFPEDVNHDLAKKQRSTMITEREFAEWRKGKDVARKVTPQGYLGDPANYDPLFGKTFIEAFARNAALAIQEELHGEER